MADCLNHFESFDSGRSGFAEFEDWQISALVIGHGHFDFW